MPSNYLYDNMTTLRYLQCTRYQVLLRTPSRPILTKLTPPDLPTVLTSLPFLPHRSQRECPHSLTHTLFLIIPIKVYRLIIIFQSLSFRCSCPRTSPSLCEMKNRTPLPVPSGAPSVQNGHSRNPSSGLDMAARSPPNQSSKYRPGLFYFFFFLPLNHILLPSPIALRLPARLSLSMTVFAPLLTSLCVKERENLISVAIFFRYQACSLQILSPGSLPGRSCLSFPTLYGRRD